MSEIQRIAERLHQLADQIEAQPQAREQIAAGFRLVALAMAPLPLGTACEDCTSQQGQALDPDDNPEAGADTAPAGVDLVDTATGPGLEG